MQEWSAIIKTITDKIGEFLNIFDLSFLVSGAACLSSFYFIYTTLNEAVDSINMPIAIMAAYILGLLCFTIGRWARKDFRRKHYDEKFDHQMKETLDAHAIWNIAEYKQYFRQDQSNYSSLYVRIWADLRETKNYRISLGIINRYWVMAATYDGLAIACFIWLGALEFWWWRNGINLSGAIIPNNNLAQISVSILMFLISVGISYRCWCEAARYSRHQVEEIIATIASWKNDRGAQG